MAERVRCETIILEITGLKPIRSKVLLIRGLFLFFFFHFIKSCSRLCLLSAPSHLCIIWKAYIFILTMVQNSASLLCDILFSGKINL